MAARRVAAPGPTPQQKLQRVLADIEVVVAQMRGAGDLASPAFASSIRQLRALTEDLDAVHAAALHS